MNLFDGLGRLFFIFSSRSKKKHPKFSHALVIRLDHLGDIFFATAIPKLLKENLGINQITFLTSSVGALLLQNNPFVDQVVCYDAPWFRRSRKNGGESYWRTIQRLKKMKIDLALSLRGDLRENFLAFFSGSGERIGYGVTGGGFFLTRELPYRWQAHEREHSLDILKLIGIHEPILEPKIYFSEAEEKSFSLKRASWGLDDTTPIGVQLEAGSRAKEWPEENIRSFLSLAAQKLGRRKFIFVGTDKHRFSWLDKFLQENPALGRVNLIGQTNLRELFYCLKHLSAFIGPDSGPAHVAASFKIPTLFLYSGTNVFEQWKSLEESADFLRNAVSCSPCHLTDCSVEGHPCMSGIESAPVVDWILERTRER